MINGEIFVGVATQSDFRVFQSKHKVVLACNAKDAQYLQNGEVFYRANWMLPVTTDMIPYKTVDIVRIDEDEYHALLNAIEVGEDIEVEQKIDSPVEEEVSVNHNEIVTVEYLKSSKIAEMKNICNKTIESGIDVVMSDDTTHHFSLTTQDQLNLITLSSMISAGETEISYHADGELCKFYSAEDIATVIRAATDHKSYHIAYFNSLKWYIGSMDAIEEISAVKYGMAIPNEFQSEPLKVIIGSTSDNT